MKLVSTLVQLLVSNCRCTFSPVQRRRAARYAVFALLSLGSLLLGASSAFAANPDGALRTEVIAAYNLVVDSNVESPSTYAPRSAYLGATFHNDGSVPLTNVFVYIGDYTNNTPGVYPRRAHLTLTGFAPDGKFALTHQGGSAGVSDATRYIGTILPGQSVTAYWLVSYPNLDGAGHATWGPSVKPDDDLWLNYDVWAKGTQSGIQRTSVVNRTVTMRNEISAMANKILPNGANKVPSAYLDLLGVYAPQWTNVQVTAISPGTKTALQGFWYDLGDVGFGFDNNGDFTPDHNAWMQPVGDPSLIDSGYFRLVRTYAMVIVKLKTGGEQVITTENQLYFENVPENTGAVGFVGYEYMAVNGPAVAQFTPYQEVASGYDNEKFNGDYGAGLPPLYSSSPEVLMGKDANVSTIGVAGTIQYTINYTNNSTNSVGSPANGAPLVIQDHIITGTRYVAGSAASANVLPSGVTNYTILYSTNSGTSWLTTEPTAATNVTDLQWWLSDSLPAGGKGTVKFSVTVNSPFTNSNPQIDNVAGLSFGSGFPFVTDDATTLVLGTNSLNGTVFADTGTGGGVFGNALKESGETGIQNIKVSLYSDVNTNGILDSSDVFLFSSNSLANGTYSFTNLFDGKYLVLVDFTDTDLATGYTITTVTTRAVDLDSTRTNANAVISTGNDFGFAPAFILDKNIVGSTNLTEGSFVTNTIDLINLLPGDGTGLGSPSKYTVWATNSTSASGQKSWTNPQNAANAPDGSGATGPFANAGEELYTSGYSYPTQTGNITNVDLVVVARTNSAFSKASTLTLTTYSNSVGIFTNTLVVSNYFNSGSFVYYYMKIATSMPWTVFNGTTLSNVLGTTKAASESGTLDVDAVGFRVTTDVSVGASTTATTLDPVPLTDTYRTNLLSFISSDPSPDTTTVGTLTWANMGPIYPGGTNRVTLIFKVLEPPTNTALSSIINTAAVFSATYGNGRAANTATDTVAAAISPSGSIGDFVWRDLNSNGVYNVGEPGISGVSVVLSNTLTLVSITNVTDSTGFYLFTGITDATNYVVKVLTSTLPVSFVQTFDRDGIASANQATITNFNPLATDGSDKITDADFGYRFTTGLVDGYIWNDLNRSGTTNADTGEPMLSGITVKLYSGTTAVATNTTDTSGYFRFTNLAAGTYSIVVTNSTGALTNGTWTQSFDTDGVASSTNQVTVTLVTGGAGRGDFSYYKTGNLALGDTLFYDWNGNGTQDANDEGIPNITVKLYADLNTNGVIDSNSDPLILTTSTDSSGHYLFSGLATNAYIVVVDESDPQFPVHSYQTADPDGVKDGKSAVLLTATDLTRDFGYQPYGTGTIGDFVWHDVNSDGVQNIGENGIANITVTLYADFNGDNTYVAVATNTTSSTGYYTFSNLPAGNYRVVVDSADPDLPDDPFGNNYSPTTATSKSITLASGESNLTADFGFNALGAIGDTVFWDANGNGTQDYNETGVSNVTVNLYYDVNTNRVYDIGEPLVATKTTSTNGTYLFTGLTPSNYVVVVVTSSGPLLGTTITADPDMDGAPCTGSCDGQYGRTIGAGVSFMGADFGYQPPGVIGDTVWIDSDNNGLVGATESGIPYVTVELRNTANILIATNVTDADGHYLFYNVTNGTYKVIVLTSGTNFPSGLTATYDADGTATLSQSTVTIANGGSNLAQDFGYRYAGNNALSGTIGLDVATYDGLLGTNGSGIKAGEVAYANVPVSIYRWIDNGNGVVDSGEKTFIASTTTATNGDYSFTGLPNSSVSNYFIVSMSAPFDNLRLTTVTSNTPALSVVKSTNALGDTVSAYQIVTNRSVSTNIDFAFMSTVNYDFGDLPDVYGTSLASNGPRHIVPTTPTLYLGASVDTESDGSPGITATGDGADENGVTTSGAWQTGATNGNVSVTVTGSGWLLGWVDFNQNGSFADTNDLVINQAVTNGTYNLSFNVPSGSISATTNTALYARFRLFSSQPLVPAVAYTGEADNGEVEDYLFNFGSIGDYVWNDRNGDGIQDADEAPIAGVRVFIDQNGDGQYQVTEPSAITSATGAWNIGGLVAGTYSVIVDTNTLQSGLTVTGDPDGTKDGKTSVTLTAGQVRNDLDFGYRGSAGFGDLVWNDANGDGSSVGESGINGIRIFLDLNNDGIFQSSEPSTVTAGGGLYSMGGLLAGTYTVRVDTNTLPFGATPTYDFNGVATPNVTSLTLTSGTTNLLVDWGYLLRATVGNQVFIDLNNNGIKDAGETGIDGVRVELLYDADSNGLIQNGETNAIGTNITANGGIYSFTNLAIGNYQIRIAATNFTAGQALAVTNYSSQTTVTTDDSIDDDDNGIQAGGAGTVTVSPVFQLSSGETDNTKDFGFFALSTVTGHLYYDVNGNGVQSGGEPNLTNITVTLTSGTNVVLANSDASGNWSAQVPPGSVSADVLNSDPDFAAQVPAGYSETEGDDPTVVVAVSGQTVSAGNDGYYTPATVTGHLYYDVDGNGVQSGGEPNLTNITVTVTSGTNVVLANTDASGNWSAQVPPGSVSADVLNSDPDFATQVPAGYSQTDGNDPTVVVALAGQTTSAGNDGYYTPATVTGHLYYDVNGNGVQSGGEPNLTNITVTVTSGTNVVLANTDTNGNWSVQVPPGSVSADVLNSDPDFATQVPSGYSQTDGTDPTVVIAPAGQTTSAGNDGYYTPATVHGHLYFDKNGNGTQNVGEPNLTNVTVVVTSGTNVVFASSDTNGNWTAQVPPGSVTNDVFNADPDFTAQIGNSYTQTEGNDPTIVSAPAGQDTFAGIDGYWDNVPTLALLSSIRGYVENHVATIEWTTASEVGTLGFDLYRQKADGTWVQVNTELVLALNSITGGTYKTQDVDAAIPGTYLYKLVEWEQDGNEIVVGSYTLNLSEPISVTATREGDQLKLQWQGGTPPYYLEKKSSLGSLGAARSVSPTDWIDVPLTDPSATTITVPIDSSESFYRIRSELK